MIKNLYKNEVFRHEKITFVFPADNDASMISELKEYGYSIHEFPRYERGTASYFLDLMRFIRMNRFDIVHIHGNSHALIVELLAALVGGCNIRICHSHNTTCNNKIIHWALGLLFNCLCTDRFACGEDAGKWMYGKKRFRIVHNCIDTERFLFNPEERMKIRKEYGIDEKELVLGHVGNFNEQKNQIMLLKIVHEILKTTNCKCMLIGEGETRKRLEEKCKELKIENTVIFCGVTSAVESYLSAMDIIVMPSIYEGLPLSLIEEQANGLKCVVSSTITKEVDKTGNVVFIVDPNDISMWKSTIIENATYNNRSDISLNAIQNIIESGYDIKTEVSNIYSYYISRLKEINNRKSS